MTLGPLMLDVAGTELTDTTAAACRIRWSAA